MAGRARTASRRGRHPAQREQQPDEGRAAKIDRADRLPDPSSRRVNQGCVALDRVVIGEQVVEERRQIVRRFLQARAIMVSRLISDPIMMRIKVAMISSNTVPTSDSSFRNSFHNRSSGIMIAIHTAIIALNGMIMI